VTIAEHNLRDTPMVMGNFQMKDIELLSDEQKAIYVHGFIIGLMTGHTEPHPEPVQFYMETQGEMFIRMSLDSDLISKYTLEMLQELDVFQLYQATKNG